jgi:hypothetical protein
MTGPPGRDSDEEGLPPAPPDGLANAADQRAVADRHDDRDGRRLALLEDLLSDGPVTLILRGLRAVLEEGEAVLQGILPGRLLGLIQVSPDQAHAGAVALDERELRPRRFERRVNGRGKILLPRRPGDGGTVIASRGRDDAGRPRRERLDSRQSAAPRNAPSACRSSRLRNAGPGTDGVRGLLREVRGAMSAQDYRAAVSACRGAARSAVRSRGGSP